MLKKKRILAISIVVPLTAIVVMNCGGKNALTSSFSNREQVKSSDEVSQKSSALKRIVPESKGSQVNMRKDLSDSLGDRELENSDRVVDFDQAQAKSEYGVDRLMMMAFHNRPEVFQKALEELLNNESYPKEKLESLKDKEGSGLLHWAAMGDCHGCIDLLLAKGFPVDSPNNRGETALVYGASSGDEVLTAKLLKAGANPNIKFNEAGYTLLMDASFEGQIEVARSLIGAKANINTQDKEGKSPLHYAAKEGHRELIELLISSGANPNLTDKNGQKALDYALEYHDDSIKDSFKSL